MTIAPAFSAYTVIGSLIIAMTSLAAFLMTGDTLDTGRVYLAVGGCIAMGLILIATGLYVHVQSVLAFKPTESDLMQARRELDEALSASNDLIERFKAIRANPTENIR